MSDLEITTAPLTPDRFDDVAEVFARGLCKQCWCMYWRLPRKEFQACQGDENRRRFEARVAAGPPPGLLAYAGGEPVGWIQIGPRADVAQWNGARRLSAPLPDAPVEDPAVWAVSCFTVRGGWRRMGVATALLDAALDWARAGGARVIEACPVEPEGKRPAISLYHGIAAPFRRAGFAEVARRRPDRPLLRLQLGPDLE